MKLAQPQRTAGAYPDVMRARDLLSDYLLDELPAGKRAAFEAALRDDPELRAEVERLQPVVTLLEAHCARCLSGYSSSSSSST